MNSPVFPAVSLPHLARIELPPVRRVGLRQPTAPPIDDVAAGVAAALGRSQRLAELSGGAEIAVAIGSRGVARIGDLARATVAWLRARGFRPFVVPAMGTHGGATPEGQRGVLAHLGITEASIDCPIRATMEVVDLGGVADGVRCKFDAEAFRAAAVVPIARVKSHTSFDRPIESGLTKMVAVGLGKAEGARNVHRLGPRGMTEILPSLAALALDRAPIAYGIAVVESGSHEIVHLEGVEPESFMATDARLLGLAKRLLARLPFTQIDALTCEWVGKEISGAGMDYAVIGRTDIRGIPNPEHIFINKIAVLGCTTASSGNALGIGVADFIPVSLANGLDLTAMYMNSVSAALIEKARIPVVLPTEREVLQALVATSWATDPAKVRYCQIRSTLHLDEILVSQSLADELADNGAATAIGEPEPLRLDLDGVLTTRV